MTPPDSSSQPPYLKSRNIWGLYRAFLTFSVFQSLIATAAALGISVPTLKRRLESLEEALETKLYGRHGKEFELTVSGDILVSKLQRADGLLEGLFLQSGTQRIRNRPQVRIQAESGIHNHILWPVITANPEIIDRYACTFYRPSVQRRDFKEQYDIIFSSYQNDSGH